MAVRLVVVDGNAILYKDKKEMMVNGRLEMEDSDGTHPLEGLYLSALLRAFQVSAFDWPEAIGQIGHGLDELFTETMYPGEAELEVLRQLEPDYEWSMNDLCFDT